jgi:hypothetical protein
MREKQTPFPTDPRLTKDYYFDLTRTDAFLEAQEHAYNNPENRNLTTPAKDLATFVMQKTIAHTAKKLNKNPTKYDTLSFSPIYNELLSTLPDLSLGIHNLENDIGNRIANVQKIIPFNHTIKQLINENSATTPANLEGMLKNTLAVGNYSDHLLEYINRYIIPGMNQELALEANLLHLPGQPEIINTDIHKELKGIDYIARLDNGIEINIDGKSSEHAAKKTQAQHDQCRRDNRIRTPDTRLILHTGYAKADFIPNKIGRVTDEARRREQPRIDAVFRQKYIELRQARATA